MELAISEILNALNEEGLDYTINKDLNSCRLLTGYSKVELALFKLGFRRHSHGNYTHTDGRIIHVSDDTGRGFSVQQLHNKT